MRRINPTEAWQFRLREVGIWQARRPHPHLNPMAWRPHPFVLDVRPVRHMPGRFVYSVGRMRGPKHHSLHTYATFEEARLAGKAALDATVEEWKRRECVEQLA